MRWKLTVRSGSRVKRRRFDHLEPALGALESQAGKLADSAPDRALDTKLRRFEPAERVLARLELAGPERFMVSVRAGVDVRGDGSVQVYRGRVRRRMIEIGSDESPYAALRRAIASEA